MKKQEKLILKMFEQMTREHPQMYEDMHEIAAKILVFNVKYGTNLDFPTLREIDKE